LYSLVDVTVLHKLLTGKRRRKGVGNAAVDEEEEEGG